MPFFYENIVYRNIQAQNCSASARIHGRPCAYESYIFCLASLASFQYLPGEGGNRKLCQERFQLKHVHGFHKVSAPMGVLDLNLYGLRQRNFFLGSNSFSSNDTRFLKKSVESIPQNTKIGLGLDNVIRLILDIRISLIRNFRFRFRPLFEEFA